MMILIINILTLSIIFFGISAVEASTSDLDYVMPYYPDTIPEEPPTTNSTGPETNSRTQDGAESAKGNTRDSIKPQDESQTQDEAGSGGIYTKVYPTEEEYCRIQILDDKPTREGYTLKFGTNNADELYGTPKKDLIFGLDGNDHIYGLEGGDIICGGKGNDVIEGDPRGYNSDEVLQSNKGDNGDLPKSVSADLIFGQEGKIVSLEVKEMT